jgi:hypothetical protein
LEIVVMSAPQADIGHNSGASRKAFYIAEITKVLAARKAKNLDDTLSRQELGALSSTDRIIALKHGMLDNYRVMYAMFPQLDVLPGVVAFVTIFSDHGGMYDNMGRCIWPPGCCTYSMANMAKFFSRSEEAIRQALKRAVKASLLHRHKPNGGKYSHWPVVFKGILDPSSSPTWFVDASLPLGAGPPQGSFGCGGPSHRKPPLGDHPKPDGGDHPKPDGNVFPRENILEGEPSVRDTSRLQPKSPNNKQHDLDWLQALNVHAAARKAFAVSQIAVGKTGKVTIGAELHAALREDFTDSQIERGLEKAARYMEGGPDKRMASVRAACGWAKDDDRKEEARRQSAVSKLQPVRRTFPR